MVAIGDLIGALGAVTSICAVNVALFDFHADALSAFAERVGDLTAMMRLAVGERDEAIAERDLAAEALESEVARLLSILSNDHTNCGATTAVDRQSATGHRGPRAATVTVATVPTVVTLPARTRAGMAARTHARTRVPPTRPSPRTAP